MLPPLIFLLFSRKLKKESTALILYSLVIFSFNFFYDYIYGTLGTVYYLIYTFIEYICFAYILWINILNKKFRVFIFISAIAFFIFQVIYFLIDGKRLLDSIPIGVESILVLIYIFYFFFGKLKSNTESVSLYQQPPFWFATGILIYLSGTFFFYILVNHMPKAQILQYWFITYIFDILKNVFFAAGIMVIHYTKEPSKTHQNVPNLDFN